MVEVVDPFCGAGAMMKNLIKLIEAVTGLLIALAVLAIASGLFR